MTENMRTHIASLRRDACLIQGGLTSNLEPAEMSWNKPFKEAYRDKSVIHRLRQSQGSGNLKVHDKITCVQLVKKTRSTISTDVIVKSFKACGITSSTDGSKDGSIHCLKPGGVERFGLHPTRKSQSQQHL